MTQPPSPSAAALEAATKFIREKEIGYGERVVIDKIAALLDAFAAQVVAAAQGKQHERGPNEKGRTFYEDPAVCDPPKTLVSVCPHPAKCEEMAVAAERAKPAASDPTFTALKTAFENWFHDAFFDGEDTDDAKAARELAMIAMRMFSAALAERGRVERERAAKIAEAHDADPDMRGMVRMTRARIAAAIRNQTGDNKP